MSRVLLTGASSGIGEAAALLLAKHHQVVATVRTPDARAILLQAASDAGVSLEVVLVDVTDRGGVEGVVADMEVTGGIDVLLHNAGTGYVGTLEQLEFSKLREAMEVNFFGAAQMVQAVLPHMRANGSGKVIVVSSVGGAVGQPFNDAYCAAKFAVEGLLESLHPVAASVGISISLVEPGPVATKFIANLQGLDEVLSGDPSDPYASAKANYMSRLGSPERMAGMQTSMDVAEVLVDIVNDPSPKLRYQTSSWSTEFVATKLSDLDGSAVAQMTGAWVAD